MSVKAASYGLYCVVSTDHSVVSVRLFHFSFCSFPRPVLCDAVLTTSNTVGLNALDYGRNAQSISRQFSIGIQKFSTGSGTANWRPWVKFLDLQGRTVKNTTATFAQSSDAAGRKRHDGQRP